MSRTCDLKTDFSGGGGGIPGSGRSRAGRAGRTFSLSAGALADVGASAVEDGGLMLVVPAVDPLVTLRVREGGLPFLSMDRPTEIVVGAGSGCSFLSWLVMRGLRGRPPPIPTGWA